MEESIENIQLMSPKKETLEVYVPPRRRSANDKPVSNSSPRRKLPPNCCEESEEMEEKEVAPPADEKKVQPVDEKTPSPKPRSSFFDYHDVPQKFLTELPYPQIREKKQKKKGERIKVNNRVIAGQNTSPKPERNLVRETKKEEKASLQDSWRKPPEPQTSSEQPTELQRFHANEVPYIDSHCHTDFIYTYFTQHNNQHVGINEWADRIKEAFPRSFAGFIANFIQPNLFVLTSETNNSTYDLEWVEKEVSGSDLYLGTTWGCHPHHAQTWCKSEVFWDTLDLIFRNGFRFKVLAVGECGIDLHRCATDLEVQKEVFKRHVELAFKYQLPLVIHCRNGAQGQSEDACLDILDRVMQKNHRNLKIHRHCYTEDWPTAVKWLKQCPDVHFGFTPGIFSFKAKQIEAIRRIPMDRILLETDAPYFKPKSFDGVGPSKCSMPGMAIAVAYRIAEIKRLPVEEVLRTTYNNTRRLYQLPVY